MARVLVLDDEELMREALRIALERDGHEVCEAGDGAAGLSLFNERPIDLVITDLIMPNMDGVEMIRDLRRASPKVKIIALSGRGGISIKANLDRALMVGANCALMKPCDFDELRRTVSELTGKQPADSLSPG
jgi:DNA-binding response OmpR family regulator